MTVALVTRYVKRNADTDRFVVRGTLPDAWQRILRSFARRAPGSQDRSIVPALQIATIDTEGDGERRLYRRQ